MNIYDVLATICIRVNIALLYEGVCQQIFCNNNICGVRTMDDNSVSRNCYEDASLYHLAL